MAAALLTRENSAPALVLGADEFHETLTPCFDPSAGGAGTPADGGGALCVVPDSGHGGTRIAALFLANPAHSPSVIDALLDRLGGGEQMGHRYGAIFVGIPRAYREVGIRQLRAIRERSGFSGSVIPYRQFTGEFASASASAAALAVTVCKVGEIPSGLAGPAPMGLQGKGILMLGLGRYVTAMEILSGNAEKRGSA
jgi:3-oxoacyl-[acyl-carrier-protein] synthase-1/3-oxoacyl-[acyl-carrier-protein] synthase II